MEIKTLDLSFCSDKAHNVVNSEAKELIINKLKKYDILINSKRAFILNSKSIYFLEKTQHIISIKSSGTNYYLFFTNINNINYGGAGRGGRSFLAAGDRSPRPAGWGGGEAGRARSLYW